MCRAVYSVRAVWLRVLSCKLNAIVFRVYDDSPQGAYFVLFSVVAITLRFHYFAESQDWKTGLH